MNGDIVAISKGFDDIAAAKLTPMMPVDLYTARYTGARKVYTFCDLLDEEFLIPQPVIPGPLKIDEKAVKIVLRNDKVGVALLAYAEEPCEVEVWGSLTHQALYELARSSGDDFVVFSFCQAVKCATSTAAHLPSHVVTVSWRFIRSTCRTPMNDLRSHKGTWNGVLLTSLCFCKAPLAETPIDDAATLWKNKLDIPTCYLRTGDSRIEEVVEAFTGETPEEPSRSKRSKNGDESTRKGKRASLRPAKTEKDAQDTERQREEDIQMMEG